MRLIFHCLFLIQEYQPKLCSLCEAEGRSLVVIHLYFDDSENHNATVSVFSVHNLDFQKGVGGAGGVPA